MTVIQNTSLIATPDAADVLTALFFQGGGTGLSVVSETLPGTDEMFHNTDVAYTLGTSRTLPNTINGNAVQAWQEGTSGATVGVGIGGLGFAGFGGINSSKDGLVSKSYTPTDGLSHDGDSVFDNAIVILLSGNNINLGNICDIQFNYGTSMDTINGNSVVAVPEPSTWIAGLSSLLPFGMSALRVLRKRQAA